MIEVYTCDGCGACVKLIEWLDQHDIEYREMGEVKSIDEYPVAIVDGKHVVGWGDIMRQAILGGESDE